MPLENGSRINTCFRAVSVALIPLTVAPFVGPSLNPVLDSIFCALLVAHSHVGFQYVTVSLCTLLKNVPADVSRSCIIDYFPKRRVPKTRTALEWVLRLTSLATIIGLYEFETNDVGLTEAVKRVWKAA